ncbi:DUF6691 family protein [Celerinatantimonas yamalensis]|uniref:DUF6691 family protein n=1 Tax=Celerinatantimonas yamalensis TaxID=559956 RepID=A0ABW9G3Z0_9GAMM
MVIAWLVGLLFGAGLVISQMVDPQRVIGFLHVTHDWDPTLLFVMGGALVVFSTGYWVLVRRMKKPLLALHFELPTRRDFDWQLIVGAALFGVGWGLVGICPGPAITSISSAATPLLLFVIAMLSGMWLANQVRR